MTPEWKGEVPTLDLLNRMVTQALPLGLRSGPVEPFFQRDIYFDSADWTLRRRGVSCRFRIRVDDRRILTLRTIGRWEGGVPILLPQTFEADVPDLEGEQALAGTSDPARRLRSLIEPALLRPRIQFETERRVRHTRPWWFSRGRYEVLYDVVTVRTHELAQTFQELKLREVARGRPGLDRVARAFQEQYGLRPLLVGKVDRAAKLLRDLESGALAQVARGGREVALVAVEEGSVAMLAESTSLTLPVRGGKGEETCREILRTVFGSADGQVRFLGTAPGGLDGTRPVLEVWLARRVSGGRAPGTPIRLPAPPDSRRRPPGTRALLERRPELARVQRSRPGAGGGRERAAPRPAPVSVHPEREPGRVFHGPRRRAETRGGKGGRPGGGGSGRPRRGRRASRHRDPGAGAARAAGSLFHRRVPAGTRGARRPDPALVGPGGGPAGGAAPLLQRGNLSVHHAAGHDAGAGAPLPAHSQLATLPRRL